MGKVSVGQKELDHPVFAGAVENKAAKFGVVVESESGIFGAAFFPFQGELYVHNICGNPSPKYLRFLKETAVKFARRLKCGTVSLDIEENQKGYAKLATRMGFTKSKEFSRMWELNLGAAHEQQ